MDKAKSDAFGERLIGMLNQGAMALMTSVGHRVGLFDAMAGLPAATSAKIAEAAGLNERYVREWLGAMVTGGFVEYDPAGKTYRLPPEHAAWLTRTAVPQNLAQSAQWIPLLGAIEDEAVAAFKHGRGIPYSSYHRFHEVMADESEQTVVHGLKDHIIPLVPGLAERLAGGATALDIGCGSGRAIIKLAELFPAGRFVGYDVSPEAIDAARKQAAALGAANARFEVHDLAEMTDAAAFDAVFAFDAVHDQSKPDRVLSNVAKALKPGGLFLMQDIAGTSRLERDVGQPFGPYLYTVSCLHCMSVSLANGGPGLGAMWGKETALAMLTDAGFGEAAVHTLPHDPINYYYVARPRSRPARQAADAVKPVPAAGGSPAGDGNRRPRTGGAPLRPVS